MTIADTLDITSEQDLHLLDVLTAKRLGWHTKSFENTFGKSQWTSHRLCMPNGEIEGDSYDDPLSCWSYPPMFHRTADHDMLVDLGEMFSLGKTPFRAEASSQIREHNAYWCHIWNFDINIEVHAPTVALAIVTCWNDFYEQTHLDQGDAAFIEEMRQHIQKREQDEG